MIRHQGASLISLMIGLLVSSVVVIGMMMVFRNTVQTVVPASEAARSEGERIAALLAGHLMLNDAGFGIDSPSVGNDLVMINSAILSGTALISDRGGGNALVWGMNLDGDNRCQGLLAQPDGRVLRLSSDDECTSASAQWGSLNWTGTAVVLDARLRVDGDPQRPLGITVNTGTPCRPFGVGNGGVAGSVTVALTYPVNVGGVTQTATSTTCLANFRP